MKRVLIIGTIAIIVISLVGCGAKSTNTKTATNQTTTTGAKNSNSTTSNTENSKSTTSTTFKTIESNKTLIAGWPKNVPIVEGTLIQSGKAAKTEPKTGKQIPGKYTFSVVKLSKLSSKSITEFYQAKFTDKASTKINEGKGLSTIIGVIDSFDIVIYVAPQTNGSAQVQIFCSEK